MPRRKLDIETGKVHEMAVSGCSNTEIANSFGCDEATIRKRFSEILATARSTRRWKLRKMQNKAANKGNVQMLIWLGKNELGQSDRQTHEHTGTASFTLDLGGNLRATVPPDNGHANSNGNGNGRITAHP